MEEAMIVIIPMKEGEYGSDEEQDALSDLEELLFDSYAIQAIGKFDGDECGDGECHLYFYGACADALFEAAKPILMASPLIKGSVAILRYGPPGAATPFKQIGL